MRILISFNQNHLVKVSNHFTKVLHLFAQVLRYLQKYKRIYSLKFCILMKKNSFSPTKMSPIGSELNSMVINILFYKTCMPHSYMANTNQVLRFILTYRYMYMCMHYAYDIEHWMHIAAQFIYFLKIIIFEFL